MRMGRRTALGMVAAASAALASPSAASEPISVYAVNAPLAYFATRLAGDAAEVIMPVPQGRDPALWRPSIADVAAVQAADLIVLNGAGYAQWAAKTSLPRSRTVDTSRGFADRLIPVEGVVHSHGAEGEHSHTGTASITWLDFAQAAEQAGAIAEALKRRAPDAADRIDAALADIVAELEALDAEASALGDAAGDVHLISSHPRYQYFARAYDLEMASLDWEASETPSVAQWAELDTMRADAARVVMVWEAEPTGDTRDRLEADDIGIVVFPTLADAPADVDFVAAMRDALGRLGAALAP